MIIIRQASSKAGEKENGFVSWLMETRSTNEFGTLASLTIMPSHR